MSQQQIFGWQRDNKKEGDWKESDSSSRMIRIIDELGLLEERRTEEQVPGPSTKRPPEKEEKINTSQ